MHNYLCECIHMKIDIRQVLSDNLSSIKIAWKYKSVNDMARKNGLEQTTLDRIIKKTMSPTVDKIVVIAGKFDLQAWQLLLPGLDPKNPPIFVMTDSERSLYEKLKEAAKQVATTTSPYN